MLFQGGLGTWKKNDPMRPELLPDFLSQEKMANMERIEAPAEQGDPPTQKMLRSTWILSLGVSLMSRP